MATTLYGCSDDLIECDGTLHGEVNAYLTPTKLRFVAGESTVLFSGTYGQDGAWRFAPLSHSREELEALGFVFHLLPETWTYKDEGKLGYSDKIVIPPAYDQGFSWDEDEEKWTPIR